MKQSIILSLPVVWGIRNFVLSRINKALEHKYEIYYAIPVVGLAYMLALGVPRENLIELERQPSNTLQRWCNLIIRQAHRKRFPNKSDQVFAPLMPVSSGGVRNTFLNSAAWIFSIPFLFNILEQLAQRIFLNRIDKSFLNQIKRIQPTFALSTSCVVDTEWPLFRMLHHLKVPVYTHILSFDNLTSRGYIPIRYFNEFLVWNTKMAEELKHIYAIPDARITITGTPQFDFHTHQQYLRSREWTQKKLGISEAPFMLYCANHLALTPDEPQLVEQIAAALNKDLLLRGYQLVLRLHPMDDYNRWNDLLHRLPDVKVSLPWPHKDETSLFWGDPTTEDLILFSNTLRYSSMVFNIASSVSIDAAILDKPVVCVGFSSDVNNKYHSLYYNYHYSHHYEPIMATGATPLATDLVNLCALAREGIEDGDKLAPNRKRMVQLLCGDTDGGAAERIFNFISDRNN